MTSRTVARLTGSSATVLVTAAMAVVPLAGVANAAPTADDLNCRDFASQSQAQQHFDDDTSDPDQLDEDNDGQACENHKYGPTGGGQGQAGNPDVPEESGSGDQNSGDDRNSSDEQGSGDRSGGTTQRTGTAGTGGSSGSSGQVGTTPVGSVDAGDGSAVAAGAGGQADDPMIFILGGFGALAATGAGAAVWNTRRSGTSRR